MWPVKMTETERRWVSVTARVRHSDLNELYDVLRVTCPSVRACITSARDLIARMEKAEAKDTSCRLCHCCNDAPDRHGIREVPKKGKR